MIYFLVAVNGSSRIRFVSAICQLGKNNSPTSQGHPHRLSITLKLKTSTRSPDGAAFLGLRTPRSDNTHSIKNNLRTSRETGSARKHPSTASRTQPLFELIKFKQCDYLHTQIDINRWPVFLSRGVINQKRKNGGSEKGVWDIELVEMSGHHLQGGKKSAFKKSGCGERI